MQQLMEGLVAPAVLEVQRQVQVLPGSPEIVEMEVVQ